MKINVNNIALNYEKIGNGPPLILLHGNGETHHIFCPLMEKLKRHFTLYAIDSRNHGESTYTKEYSYHSMAKDIEAFIHTLNLQQPFIVGFSDGAIISLLLALQQPHIFSKMALLGINLKVSDFKQRVLQDMKSHYQKTQDPLFKMMLEQPNISLSCLKNITIPTLIIAAQHELCYRKLYRNMAKTLPNSQLKIMLGHDHCSYIVHQDFLYPDLMAFLKNK